MPNWGVVPTKNNLREKRSVNNNRPVNLDLTKFKFPLPALTSIAHRITGVALFVGMIFLLCMLDLSLSGEEGFAEARECMDSFLGWLITWGLVSSLLYHLVAGIKHLVMDFGIGETLEGGVLGAKITIAVSAALIIIAGIWLW